jgi:catechol 2,3-dioxygenase-like lactoylglutathione lyase family enzyme
MNSSLDFVALVVPDLRAAERYYQSLFGMELIGREAELEHDLWFTLPFDKGWDEAEAAGIVLDTVALRKDEFVLVLMKGDAPAGQVSVIGVKMLTEELVGVRARLPKEAEMSKGRPDYLEFRDPYRIVWQVTVPGGTFRTAGDFANRWIKL